MNCDRIARWYALLEHAAFGWALERCRTRYLPEITCARRILALGDGDGRALVALLKACPDAQIDYVDLSAQMLALARQRTGANPRVTFLQADARMVPLPDQAYDAIITHFFLDCFDDQNAPHLIDRVAQAAAPNARWIVSEFRAEQWWSRAVVRTLYLLFKLTTSLQTRRLPGYSRSVHAAGFHCSQRETSAGGLLVSELWVRR